MKEYSRPELWLIGPEMARDLLAQTTAPNRPLNKRHVQELAKRMTAGQFRGGTIRLRGQDVIEGQHTLHAVIESGCSVWLQLVPVPNAASSTDYDPLPQSRSHIMTRKSGKRVTAEAAGIAAAMAGINGGHRDDYVDEGIRRAELCYGLGGRGWVVYAELSPDDEREWAFAVSFREQNSVQAVVLYSWLRRPDVRGGSSRYIQAKARAVRRAYVAWAKESKLTERALSVAADIGLGRQGS